MLMIVPVREEKQSVIPTVTHQGGTGGLQTVRRNLNPRYYRLVGRFGEATGVPVLLNTSFNLRGEPIVNSPADVFNTFRSSGPYVLVLGQFVVRK
jgi:carbamoyltransferase